ncbi:MAG: hypothetical protein QM784_18785 [Polyangiaceae bacterium]
MPQCSILHARIPPGNAQKPLPKLSIKHLTMNAQGVTGYQEFEHGGIEVPATECDAAAAPTAGVALPRLCKPDAGSMALTGKNYEGLFTGPVGKLEDGVTGFLFVTADGAYLNGRDDDVSPADYMKMGTLVPNDDPWDALDGYYCDLKNSMEISGGSYRLVNDECTYVPYTSNSLSGLQYSDANALAVTSSSVAGTWSNERTQTTFTISVDGETGTISGTSSYGEYKSCGFNGTIRLHDPSSAKNLYDVTITITNAAGENTFAACEFPENSNLKGFAALHYRNVGTYLSPVYTQLLLISAYETDKSAFTHTFVKE